ncbi:MAG: TauD/TfdA family dioxygenase [Gemmatimonadota bacterium]|nr:TauD/TfdA family dioxygenase [Gemmatimonadota bacterium]
MDNPQMLTEEVSDERAWRAGSIDDPAAWHYTLSEDYLAGTERIIRDARDNHMSITDISRQDVSIDCLGECLQPVTEVIRSGRGFAVVSRVPINGYGPEIAQSMYWLTGECLGAPMEQNIEGTLLYDVRDTGDNVAQGARFSVTNAESTFHNDNAFGEPLPDIVGLLCLRTAKSGGQSQLVSGYALHNELLENHPDVLQTLYRRFYFDRRGQFRAGDSPTSHFPVFRWSQGELTLRYLYYYIQVGHERAGKSLNVEQRDALEVVEALLRRPDFRVEFSLQPGQMLFTNNRWILHNRTAFEDDADPARRRHYVRLWLRYRD